RAPVDSRMQIDKALSVELWERLWQWLADESGGGDPQAAQLRIARAAIALMRDSGPRLSEVCAAQREKLRRAEDADDELWELTITGKRNKLRTIPVSARTIGALRAHWRDRGLDFDLQENGPLLAPVVIPGTATASAKAADGRTGYSASGLHH